MGNTLRPGCEEICGDCEGVRSASGDLRRGARFGGSKCCVVNFSASSNFRMQRALVETAGLPFAVVSHGTYLGVRIGPEAESTFWSNARLKYLTRVAHLRATAGPARERIAACMICASSVLYYLAQLSPGICNALRRGRSHRSSRPHVGVHTRCLGSYTAGHYSAALSVLGHGRRGLCPAPRASARRAWRHPDHLGRMPSTMRH